MKYVLLMMIILLSIRAGSQEARYDIKPELFLLEELGITCKPLEEDIGYSAFYYEPLSNKYYSTLIEYTNNISYNTNNIQDEKQYITFIPLIPKLPLQYVGSTDFTNRIYIDTNNNLYVKKLKLIDDVSYFDSNNHLQPILSPVFPYVRYSDDPKYSKYKVVYYTNETKEYRRVFPTGTLYD
ncbi:MAG: hypothetical protein ACRC0X_05735 [Brevinema sp.]